MEKDKEIICPICGKEKFTQEDGFIMCNHCGWEGNLDTSDPYFVELNGYSQKDYKKIYDEYIKLHPDYVWSSNTNALEEYVDSFINYKSKCPVCGEDSFEPDYRYCHKCGWHYNFVQAAFPDFNDSTNKLSLNDYKKRYEHLINENPKYEWKNTREVDANLSQEQIKWLKDNNINYSFNKLTPDHELNDIYDKIEMIQKQYESKKDYETYMFIKSIMNAILDLM